MKRPEHPGLGGEVRLKPDHCLNCGKRLDGCSVVDEAFARPKEGDFTICIKCGHLMVFGDGLKLRNPTEEELRDIAGDPRIVRASTALAAIREKPK